MKFSAGTKQRYSSRKFVLTCVVFVVGAIGWFMGRMDGENFVFFALSILTVHHGADVMQKRLPGTPRAGQ